MTHPDRSPMVPLIPRKVLFGNPEKSSPQISPDGTRLAYLAPDGGVLNLWVRTVGKEDDRAITKDRGRGIQNYFWARNNTHLLYLQDKGGDENWHLFAVPVAGGEAADLTPYANAQVQVLALEPAFPDDVAVGLNDRDPELCDVYRIDLRTGMRTLLALNDIGAVGWILDHELSVRLAQVPTDDGGFALLQPTLPSGPWRTLMSWGAEEGSTTDPIAFGGDDRTLYMLNSIGSNTGELRTLDVISGQERTLAHDPISDVSSLLIHPLTHEVQAVSFTKDREEWQVLDPAIQPDFDALRKIHTGDWSVVNRDDADRTWLVVDVQDTGPSLYYTFDRETKRAKFLFSTRPELEKNTLAEMAPVRYRTRDGLVISAYLSLPPGLEPRNLPAVINVHGGPWARDTWGYDAEAQWLANRGYACLQVNYRGSSGFGKEFLNAGDREWGAKMQDDVTDGVRWLIEKGIADPKRIAIYGGSYGGFAVLSGLTQTPDLYACGVDIVGPSNLITWMNTIPPYWEPLKPLLLKRVGDPVQDAEMLRSRSPLFHVDKIKAPLLIAQGANDPRVKREESLQIKEALETAGKTIEFMEFPDEGHGFARPENRIRFFAAAERFLARYLGGRYEN